jgi:hypothetical protein
MDDDDIDDIPFLYSKVVICDIVYEVTVHSALNDGIFPQLNFKAVSVLDRYK